MKYLIIIVSVLLLLSVTFNLSYVGAYDFIVSKIDTISNLAGFITGLYYKDATDGYLPIDSKLFGSITLDGVTYDIGDYIYQNYVPEFIKTLSPAYNVQVYLAKNLYECSFQTNYPTLIVAPVQNGLRYYITIQGVNNNVYVNERIDIMLLPSYYSSAEYTHIAFDPITGNWVGGKEFNNSLSLTDVGNLKFNIINYTTNSITQSKGAVLFYERTLNTLDHFIIKGGYREGV